jgi:AraC-like DNA-binding protein
VLGSSAQAHRTGNRTWGPPDAPASVLVAAYTSDSELFEHLSHGLPPILLVDSDPVVAPVLEALVAETAAPSAAQAAVVDRLVEVLLVATVRAWTSQAAPDAVGWPSALGDPIVGPALAAVHREPSRRWTVTELAHHSGVSRATFARRFRERVGATPSAYLTRWRLALAADLLLDPTENLTSVARQVGYADAFSLSAAFTRERGISPSAHRRRARPGPSDHHGERPADAG